MKSCLLLTLVLVTSSCDAKHESIENIIERIKSADKDQRRDGVRQIEEMLANDDKAVSANATSALSKLDMKNVGDIAILLRDENPDIRAGAVAILGAADEKKYAKDIAQLLTDKAKNDTVRKRAIAALVKFGAKEYAKDIAALLGNENYHIRQAAAQALVNLGAKEYTKSIAVLLDDKNWYVRATASLALAKFGAKEYVKDIARMIENKRGSYDTDEAYVDARSSAILALGELDAKEYTKVISAMLNDSEKEVREAAGVVLKKWGAK